MEAREGMLKVLSLDSTHTEAPPHHVRQER